MPESISRNIDQCMQIHDPNSLSASNHIYDMTLHENHHREEDNQAHPIKPYESTFSDKKYKSSDGKYEKSIRKHYKENLRTGINYNFLTF